MEDSRLKEQLRHEILLDENNMKDRLLACIAEANIFASTLGESSFFRIHPSEKNKAEMQTSTSSASIKDFVGIRYRAMMVEMHQTSSATNSSSSFCRSNALSKSLSDLKKHQLPCKNNFRILFPDGFFREHVRLYNEIKKRRGLMASSQGKECLLCLLWSLL